MTSWTLGYAPALAVALLLHACPARGPEAAPAPVAVAVAAATPAPPPPPTPTPALSEAELRPFAPDDPQAPAAAALRAAFTALDDGDLDAALGDLDAAGDYAPALAAWTRGRVLRALGRDEEADRAWAAVPDGTRWFAEATLQRAALRLTAGDDDGVLELLGPLEGPIDAASEELSLRADVLRSRALRDRDDPGDCDAAYGACKRVWLRAPEDSEAQAAAEEGMKALDARVSDGLRPTLADAVTRATALASEHASDRVVELLDDRQSELETAAPEVACPGHFELGRAWHRKREYERSVPLLEWVGENCTDPDLGARSRYLASKGLERQGRVDEAISSWLALADRFPEHRLADDGLYHAGQLELSAGRVEEAHAAFLSLPQRFPHGDMVDDALWGMAWTELQGQRWAEAVPWLDRLAEGDLSGPARPRILRGRYWQARADLGLGDAEAAIERWRALASDAPWSWYGVLALWRLHALAPDAAREVAQTLTAEREALRGGEAERDRWPADPEFLASAPLRRGIDLLRGGLHAEAAEEFQAALGPKPRDRWDLDTLLLGSHLLLESEAPYPGHNLLRMAFRRSWPKATPNQRAAFEHAYPRAYGDLISQACASYTWDDLAFQGLVREESAFSAGITSWAGAMGLSQLMWPTAKATARRMGITRLKRGDLADPLTNLRIGSTYLDGLVRRWKGHMPLAIASYNAGPGAVRRWVKSRGDQELDAFVEAIPYDETRNYVQRVTASWAIYRALYTDGPPTIPLRIGPVAQAVDQEDPEAAW